VARWRGRKEGKKFRSSSSPSSGNSQRETSRIIFQTENSTEVFLEAYQDQRIKNRSQNGLPTVHRRGKGQSRRAARPVSPSTFLASLFSFSTFTFSQPSNAYPTCFPKLTIFEHRLYRSRLLGRILRWERSRKYSDRRMKEEVGICFIPLLYAPQKEFHEIIAGLLSTSTTTSIPNLPS